MKGNFTIIKNPDKIDRTKWNDFILNHESGNIFHTPEYFDLCNCVPEYSGAALFCIKEEEIIGILVSVIQRESSGIFGKLTARSVVFGGPLVKDNDPAIASLLLAEYNKIIKSKALYSQFRNLKDMSSFRTSFSSNGYKFEDHLNVLINLSKEKKTLWSEIHSMRRRMITRSIKSGVKVSIADLEKPDIVESCYDILKSRYKEIAIPLPKIDYFKHAAQILGGNETLKLFIAEIDSKIIGFNMMLCFKSEMYYWYAAASKKYYDKHPNDALPWESFSWGIDNKYKLYDFGGAGKPDKPYGVRDFKQKFGGETINLGRYSLVHKKALYAVIMLGYEVRKMITKRLCKFY